MSVCPSVYSARAVRLANATIQNTVVSVCGALDFLEAVGFRATFVPAGSSTDTAVAAATMVGVPGLLVGAGAGAAPAMLPPPAAVVSPMRERGRPGVGGLTGTLLMAFLTCCSLSSFPV
jgi:hypothetical protein